MVIPMNSWCANYRSFGADKPIESALRALTLLIAPALLSVPVYAGDQPATQPSVAALIADLSADDAAARQAAVDKLAALGRAARPDVLAAVHGDDPQIREQATAVLLQLPWSDPNDPPKVQEILDRYNNFAPTGAPPGTAPLPPELGRQTAAAELAELPDFQGFDALIRLIYEDPSNSVRWSIFHELRTHDDGIHLIKLRRTDPAADDPALAALYGVAWLSADSPKAAPLLRQAIDEEYKNPSDNAGELDFVVNSLVDLEEYARHFDVAANLLRAELKRDPPLDKQMVPLPLIRLLQLQGEHGPLAGLDDDKAMAADFPQSGKLLYDLSHVSLRQTQPDAALTRRQAAFAAGSTSRLARYYTGKFLADAGWTPEAEAEFKAYLSMPSGDDGDDDQASDGNAHFELAALAAARDDDLTAAEEKKTAMSIFGGGKMDLIRNEGPGRTMTVSEDQVWAEIHWRYLKSALKRKDEASFNEHVAEILQRMPVDEDIANDVVPALKERLRVDEAKRLFAAAYGFAKARLDADPTNPILQNGMAWLEAKCDENLDDALKLATDANAAAPDDAAIIDTLAEVNFHLGHFDEAVKLETRALELQPEDKFMTGQLARFKAGGKQ
jgi:tetratricopeptide (TPR) repeat protein